MDREAFVDSLHHGNLVFDTIVCTAIGGSTLVFYFFLLDIGAGRVLYTPMLLGSVLFYGTPVEQVSGLSVFTVSLYTLVHFVAFGIVGLAASLLAHLADYVEDPSTLTAIAVLGIEIVSFAVAALFFPGVIWELGVARIAIANLLAVAGIATYLVHFRHKLEWHGAN